MQRRTKQTYLVLDLGDNIEKNEGKLYTSVIEAIIALVERQVFSDKKILTEFERNLVIAGTVAILQLNEDLAEATDNQEVFFEAMSKMHGEISDYSSKGPLKKLHNFYCDTCEEGVPHAKA